MATRSRHAAAALAGLIGLSLIASIGCTRTIKETRLLSGPRTPLVPDDVTHRTVEFEGEGGQTLRGAFVHARNDEPRPLVVFFYGWGGTVAEYTPWLYRLASKAEVDILSLDRRGVGASIPPGVDASAAYEGTTFRGRVRDPAPPSMDRVIADALDIYDDLARRLVDDGQPIYALGFSLGTVLALELGAERDLAGVALVGSLTSAEDWARHYRRKRVGAPWRWFIRLKPDQRLASRPQPIETIQRVDEPILLVHGARDDVTPIEFARRMRQAAQPGAQLLELPEEDHVVDLTGEEPGATLRAFFHSGAPASGHAPDGD